jgi:hypothetical protein
MVVPTYNSILEYGRTVETAATLLYTEVARGFPREMKGETEPDRSTHSDRRRMNCG